MTHGPTHMDDEIAHSHKRMAEMTSRIETLQKAARAMLAALQQVQGCPQAAPWLARGPAPGLNAWEAVRAAIAQAKAAGIET